MKNIVFTVTVRSDFLQTVVGFMLTAVKVILLILLCFRVIYKSFRQEGIFHVDGSHYVLPYSH